MQMQKEIRSILITGPPGIGKTTLVKKICEQLKQRDGEIKYHGFYTEEVREQNQGRGRRLGFDIVSLDDNGSRGVLAREASAGSKGPNVGKYCVNIDDFEAIALNVLKASKAHELLVIDEIGKMELKSKAFTAAIQSLKDKVPLLATVPLKTSDTSLAFVNKLKTSSSSKVYVVTIENRNNLLDKILDDITLFFGKQNMRML